mmetsp:Transcript_16002/g.48045  ORF Transcript_16002/g.48045 Transcript_16002/m.48045 type:complete len:324 (+) Transcript_16002:1062-2033(+)
MKVPRKPHAYVGVPLGEANEHCRVAAVVQPGASVFYMHLLHHLEAGAHGGRMGEHGHGGVPALGQHPLQPLQLLLVDVHLVHTVFVGSEAHGGQPNAQQWAQLGLPVVALPQDLLPRLQVGFVSFEILPLQVMVACHRGHFHAEPRQKVCCKCQALPGSRAASVTAEVSKLHNPGARGLGTLCADVASHLPASCLKLPHELSIRLQMQVTHHANGKVVQARVTEAISQAFINLCARWVLSHSGRGSNIHCRCTTSDDADTAGNCLRAALPVGTFLLKLQLMFLVSVKGAAALAKSHPRDKGRLPDQCTARSVHLGRRCSCVTS